MKPSILRRFPAALLFLVTAACLSASAEEGKRLEPFEPSNGEKLINYHPHFQWRGPEMTTDYQPECEIQIATEPEFQKLVATDVIGGGMNRFYSMVSLTEPRDYFWRVRIQKPEIGPWSKTFKFTVIAPEQRFEIAKGSDGATVLETLRKAAAVAKAGQTVEVRFEKGDFRLGPLKDRYAFRINNVRGLRIEGNGASITMSGDSFFAEVTGSENVEIRGLTMKWDTPGHVMMEVTKVLPDTREIDAAILPPYPLKDLEFYWPVGGGNTFLIRVDPKHPGKYTGGIKARTPRLAISNGVYRIGPIEAREFQNWQVGDRLAATHYRSGFIQNHDNEKLVLTDITFVDSPGAISGNGGRNNKVAYLNVDVVPDPRFPDCRLAGHASSEGGRIAAWIEQCDFHLLGDDNYNTGYFFDYNLLDQPDPRTLTMSIQPWDELIFAGDRLRFADQKTNRGLGEAVVVSVDNGTKDKVTVTLDRPLPSLPASTIASNNQGTQRYVYRNNRQHGGRGHGLKFKGYGALIENNAFENIAGIGIYLGCPEGPETIARSADMVTVRRNTVTLCGWHSIEAGQTAARSERLRIEDNVIRDSKTAGIFLVNVHGALVRGNTFESVTGFFAPTDSYSSIVLSDCTDVRLSDEIIKDQRARGMSIGKDTTALDKISLWANNAPIGGGKFQRADAMLTVHRPTKPNGSALIICPGGGYGGLVVGSEGHGTAQWLNEHGITGFVLEYRLPNGKSFVPMLDAQRAIRTVRARAAEWGIDPKRIGIIGFSAGGHVASTAGTHFDAGDPQAADAIEQVSCRPDFMVLVYPVISMGEKAHMGSRTNLLGKDPTPELIELFSNEKQITRETPPTFLTHALNDMAVVPDNSRMFHEALKANGVETQYLELPSGGHGLSGHEGPMWDAWQKQALEWLAAQKIIPATDAPPPK